MNVVEDLKLVSDIIVGRKTKEHVKIYFSTNEELSHLFRNVNFIGKDVFSVLGSSDQIFSSIYLGAKKVDTFDINRLSYYYYFLRRWYILYLDGTYPFIILRDDAKRKMKEVLGKVECSSKEEYQALEFWNNFLECFLEKYYSLLFYYGFDSCDVPYLNNLYVFKNKLKEKDITFKNLNFFEKIELKEKYDIVIMSNIMEYVYNGNDIRMVKFNLDNLLKKGGVAILTHLLLDSKSTGFRKQQEYFKDKFDYLAIKNNNKELGYCYIKK